MTGVLQCAADAIGLESTEGKLASAQCIGKPPAFPQGFRSGLHPVAGGLASLGILNRFVACTSSGEVGITPQRFALTS
ncbi:hypothetical protein D3C71_1879950 [compost metagenome]